MRAKFFLSVTLFLCVVSAAVAVAQTQTITHNKWYEGTSMPVALQGAPAAVLGNEIYVVGGWGKNGTVPQTQIYNPVTNSWRRGTPLPTPTCDASAAVVKNVLYVFGGQTSCPNQNVTNAVWAYYPKINKWIQKSSMPTARWETGIAVESDIIHVIGGFTPDGGDQDLSVVESYNPATDTWKEEMSLPNQAQLPAVGLIRGTIVVADGYQNGNDVTGDTESYNATDNMWTALNSDPTARGLVCAGAIGSKLYDAGGSESPTTNALTLAESFTLSTQTWKTLAQMPHGVEASGAAVYDGRLYCFGGGNDPVSDNFTHYVQIYQP